MYNDHVPTQGQSIMPSTEAGGPHLIQQPERLPDDGIFTQEEIEALLSVQKEANQRKENVSSLLATNVESKLQSRMSTRKSKENQWLESMRVYLGSLSSYNIVTGEYPFGTKGDDRIVHRPEFNIVRSKCNVAVSQTIAYQFAAGDKNWQFRAPQSLDIDQEDLQSMMQQYQNPNLSPQEAVEMRVDAMERMVEYHLEKTRYPKEARKAMYDWVVLGTGVLKGPLNTGNLKKVYKKQTTSDGKTIRIPSYTLEMSPCVYRVNLWYWFPDDTVTDPDKAEDSIEAHPMSRTELSELTKHPGYSDWKDAIEQCLLEEPRQYLNSPFNDPAYLTQGINLLKNKYLVLEYHGPIKKSDLEVLGVQGGEDTPYDEIYGEIWVCNSRVIRLQLSNLEGCNRIPYYASVWEPDPATIFGFGIPMLSRDQQRVVNETYKMVLDNAGISAGPQVVVDTTIIKPADGEMECTPFKAWYLQEYGADVSKAIQFFTPPNSFDGLSSLITLARGFADEESGITLLQGNLGTPTGLQDNATSLAIQNENAQAPLFLKAEKWDDDITHPLLDAVYDWEMQYNPDDTIKCTVDIDVRSSTAYLKGLQDQQKLDRLMQEITQGSPAAKWINMDELTLARLSSMKLPTRGIIKSPQQVAKEDAEAAQNPPPPDPNMLKAQAAMGAVENQKQANALKQQELVQSQQQHTEEMQLKYQMAHETALSNVRSHELQVQQATVNAHGTWAQGASAHQLGQAKIGAQLQQTAMQESTKKQLAGMSHVAKTADLGMKAAELAHDARVNRDNNEIKLREIASNRDARSKDKPNRNLTIHNAKKKN